jgi:hypothetical protein
MSGEAFIETEVAEQLARNEKLVETIVEHGGELDEERPIDFLFYVSTEVAAQSLAADLEDAGFEEVTVAAVPDEQVAVHAVRRASITAITDERFVRRLVGIAAKQLAEFDGWGTAI